jgi:NTF2 fold immunity protein of polymorphic toxin system component
MKIRTILLPVCLLAFAFAQGPKPKEGYVPDSKTAVKIAEAVLMPVYGEKKIEVERPFAAVLKDEIWTVTGTLRCGDGEVGSATTRCDGGVAEVQISRNDARILFMWHGK